MMQNANFRKYLERNPSLEQTVFRLCGNEDSSRLEIEFAAISILPFRTLETNL